MLALALTLLGCSGAPQGLVSARNDIPTPDTAVQVDTGGAAAETADTGAPVPSGPKLLAYSPAAGITLFMVGDDSPPSPGGAECATFQHVIDAWGVDLGLMPIGPAPQGDSYATLILSSDRIEDARAYVYTSVRDDDAWDSFTLRDGGLVGDGFLQWLEPAAYGMDDGSGYVEGAVVRCPVGSVHISDLSAYYGQ